MVANKLVWIFTGSVIVLSYYLSYGQPDCEDFLMKDVCSAYYSFGQCHLYQARRDCRKTCKVCGEGWSTWSEWKLCSAQCDGTQSRTRSCLSSALHCPGEDYEVQSCNREGAKCGDDPDELEEPDEEEVDEEEFLSENLMKHVCNEYQFRCTPDSYVCIDNDLICDGYDDCPNGFDEDFGSCALATISNSSFQIKNELMQVCLEVVTDDPLGPVDSVRGYRRCPSDYSPHRKKYTWRWWKGYNLINLYSGDCLTADDPRKNSEPSVRVEPCNDAMANQHWMCENSTLTTLLIRLREVNNKNTPRFLNLGEDNLGWPLIFSVNMTTMSSMWHKGPKEPPESICKDLQVYWSDWSTWTDCTLTCGAGMRTKNRFCVNGVKGIPPCDGSSDESEPCNRDVSCKKVAGLNQNSKCRSGFYMLDNEQRAKSTNVLDPSCYSINGMLSPKTFEGADESCKNHRGTLSSMKTEKSQEFIKDLMKNYTVPHAYLGIAEDFSRMSMLGHQFRFHFDGTAVGSFNPWKEDCIIGAGFDYKGKVNVAYSGVNSNMLKCQSWSSSSPHETKHKPLTDSDHNYCRNPNLDPQGPWCYTLDRNVEFAYCNIPQCSEFLTPFELNKDYFQIAQHERGFVSDTGVNNNITNTEDGIAGKKCLSSGGVKNYGPSGKPTGKWLKLKSCDKLTGEGSISEDQKFVWDISRRRILHVDSMLCIAATSGKSESSVFLDTCSAEKATQRWRTEDNMVLLDYFHVDENVHLDINGNDMIVSSVLLRSFSASRAGGHLVDWLGLRKAYGDESFELYNYGLDKCLALDVGDKLGKRGTLFVGETAYLTMLPCSATPRFQWMRFPASPNLLLHVQTSLCLSVDTKKLGAKVWLKKCSVQDNSQWWTCSGYKGQNIALQSDRNLVVGSLNISMKLSSSSEDNTLWIAWGSTNRTTCQFRVASGDLPVGSNFAIKNRRSPTCLLPDKVGNLVMKDCVEKGNKSDEVWSFTRAPTMIRHIKTGKCIRAGSATSGGTIMSYRCSTQDALQHWTIFSTSPEHYTDEHNHYYSLHLVINPSLAIAIDGRTSALKLRDSTAVHWDAFGGSGIRSSIFSKTDCAVHTSSAIYYGGTTMVTKYGRRCVQWTDTRYGSVFPDLEENYCRNPGRATMEPWCIVLNANGIPTKEDCGIPACSPVKVKADADGKWLPSSGQEKLPYICQSEPECYRGIGLDYIGSWNATRKGYCAFWKDHKESGFEKNYCRNPNSATSGPWCYTSKTKTSRETCPIPKCHKTCRGTPEEVYHSEVVELKTSASVYGIEEKTSITKRCHKGYWIGKNEYNTESFCSDAKWVPELLPCKMVTCSEFSRTVEGATLSASSSSLYDQYTYFTCHTGTLAGPGKSKVSFRCNEFGDWEEEDPEEQKCVNSCDEGWTQFREYCFKTFPDQKLNFTDALAYCQDLDGTLPDIDDKIMYDFLRDIIWESDEPSKFISYWTGIRTIWDKKSGASDITKSRFKSINYIDDPNADEEAGIGHLPMLYITFKIMQFSHGRKTQEFMDILPYDRRCMFGYDHTDYIVSRSCSDYMHRRMLWTWITPYHLYHVATKKCLTGSQANSKTEKDKMVAATLKKCERNNKNQYITCRRHGSASLKLRFSEASFFADDVREQDWDKVVMGDDEYGNNMSHWIIDEREVDVCHWSLTKKGNVFLIWEGTQAAGSSYSYSEAESKCEEMGGRIATQEEVDKKSESEDVSACECAWVDGNKLISVHRQESKGCDKSNPPGVKMCNSQSKADVFCYRGEDMDALDMPYGLALLLENTTRQGLQEKPIEEPHKLVCRKLARWHCPPPPIIPRAKIMETIETSYSYLGFTTYTCNAGFWFERGVFSKVVRCTYKLHWEPDPADLSCEPLYCPPPAEIVNANLTVQSVNIHGKAIYHCDFGYQFGWSLFNLEVTCETNAYWDPSPATQQCTAVTCRPPASVKHATHVTYSLSYPYNTTYTCEPGYWFEPGVSEWNSMCNGDGRWKPEPESLRCWEIVCLAPPYIPNVVWNRFGVKKMDMSCMEGFYSIHIDGKIEDYNDWNMTLTCEDDGFWHPNPEEYKCVEYQCTRPPDVQGAKNSANSKIMLFSHGSTVEYHCKLGFSTRWTFTLYNPLEDVCLMIDEEDVVYASSSACGTSSALSTRWYLNSMIQDVDTELCLSTEAVPTAVDSIQKLVMKNCNESDASQQWYCNEHGTSDLLLGINSSVLAFIGVKRLRNTAYVTIDHLKWLEWIDYFEMGNVLEQNVCKFKSTTNKQKTVCYKDDKWVPDPMKSIKCEEITCSVLPDVPHATHILSGSSEIFELPFSTAVRYTCDEGYEYLPERVSYVTRCSEVGVWAPDPRSLPCRPIRCPVFKPPYHSLITKGSVDDYEFNNEIHVKCPNGWMFRPGVFDMMARCNAKGRWETSNPADTCKELFCDPPTEVKHTTIKTTSEEFRFNTVARYTCDEGSWYYPGQVWRESFCQRSGFWEPNPTTFVCVEASCGEPPEVAHTKRDGAVARKEDERYPFGSIIFLKCSPARQFTEGIQKLAISCHRDSLWHLDPFYLKCEEIGCPKITPLPRNSFLVGTDYGIGSIIYITCFDGYRINSHDLNSPSRAPVTCLETKEWDININSISCKPISCGKPTPIRDSTLLGSTFLLDNFAQFVCDVGYWLRPGIHYLLSKCTQDGTWLPEPSAFSCEVVVCGHPGTFENGLIYLSVGSIEYNSKAWLICHDGFWIAGFFAADYMLLCNDEGLWMPAPENIYCVSVKCADPGVLPRTTREIANSPPDSSDLFDEYGNRYYIYETQLTYYCREGLQFGRQQRYISTTCGKDGFWSLDITTMSCSDIICEPPSGILFGRVIENMATSSEGYSVNSTVTFSCNKGYWFEKDVYVKEVSCLSNNQWSINIESIACIRVTCDEPPEIEHGTFINTGLTATDKTTYACNTGYRISPAGEIFCNENGIWSPLPETLKCLPVECSTQLSIPNAFVSNTNNDSSPVSDLPYGSQMQVICETGYYFSHGITKINITCSDRGNWIDDSLVCLPVSAFECSSQYRIKNAFLRDWDENEITFQCHPGFYFSSHSNESMITRKVTLKCNDTESWIPDPPTLECNEINCSMPIIKDGGSIKETLTPNISNFEFASSLTVVCDPGYAIIQSTKNGPRILHRSLSITCNETGEWNPDPDVDYCKDMVCGNPPEIMNATFTPTIISNSTLPTTRSSNATIASVNSNDTFETNVTNTTQSPSYSILNETNTTENSVFKAITYECDGHMAFSRDSVTFDSKCSDDGTWQPDPKLQSCKYYKCDIPSQPPNSNILLENSDDGLQILRLSCKKGYRILKNETYIYSTTILCNRTGQWIEDLTLLNCEAVTCNSPANVTDTIISDTIQWQEQSQITQYAYKHKVTYSCLNDMWFFPDRFTSRVTECQWDGSWKPSVEKLKCIKKQCVQPPYVDNSVVTGDSLSLGSKWIYKCKKGYDFNQGIYEQEISCQSNGIWFPDPNINFTCKAIICDPPPIISHTKDEFSDLFESEYTFYEGSFYTYHCMEGYWIADRTNRKKAIQITCEEGKWVPDPTEVIECTTIVCDVPVLVKSARVEGLNHMYGDIIFYQCAKGQHFLSHRRQKVNVTCHEDGLWLPDPYELECTDVICKDINIEGSVKEGDRIDMDAFVSFHCPSPTWLERDVTEISTVCDEDGRWQPDVDEMACKTITCEPPSLENSLVIERNLSYTNRVKLRCKPGYRMLPEVSAYPSVLCDISGNWYPDTSHYRCEAIACDPPPYVLHAKLSGNLTFDSAMRVECEAGYYFRPNMNYIDVYCEADRTWSEDFNRMDCIPVRCSQAPMILHSSRSVISSINPPSYSAQIKYDCAPNYRIEDGIFSKTIRCNESGVWDPQPDFECSEISCPRPTYKKNSDVVYPPEIRNISSQVVGTKLRYDCRPAYWISAQHALMEWSFIGIRFVEIECNKNGEWEPNLLSFQCRNMDNGPLPSGFDSGLSLAEVVATGWSKKANTVSEDMEQHQYKTAIPTGPLFWLNGVSDERSQAQSVHDFDKFAGNLWDGKPNTFFIPLQTKNRDYGVVFYLGDLFLMKGIEILSENVKNVPGSAVIDFNLAFSNDGKSFDESDLAFRTPRSNMRSNFTDGKNEPYLNESVSKRPVVEGLPTYFNPRGRSNIVTTKTSSGSFQFEGFSTPSKFVKVSFISTQNPNLPPIIQEIQFHTAPAEWAIVYPTDYFTIPSIIFVFFLIWILTYYFGMILDRGDLNVVHFSHEEGLMKKKNAEMISNNYFVRFKVSNMEKVGFIVARFVGDEHQSNLICLKPDASILKRKHVILLFGGNEIMFQPMKLEFGFVSSEEESDPDSSISDYPVKKEDANEDDIVEFEIKIAQISSLN
uniref:uncharacterized protein LOC120338112 n=1 Tax=Styela clava TaxID=7725 RepID=UPI001939E460|nr:uncharacterized protein LOC120338112 [Styela clava]